MSGMAKIAVAGLSALALSSWGPAPAHGAGNAGNAPPRMVGGGWIADVERPAGAGDTEARDRVRLAVNLPCPGELGREAARLHVNRAGSDFHLEAVTVASCSNNLHEGSGTGRCGDERALVEWHLSDGDRTELGGPDTVQLDIHGASAACALLLDAPLGGGNLHLRVRQEPE